jgi:hypothetical protein
VDREERSVAAGFLPISRQLELQIQGAHIPRYVDNTYNLDALQNKLIKDEVSSYRPRSSLWGDLGT